MKVQYEEIGLPQEGGVYACRIDDPRGSGRVIDVFLFWFVPLQRWSWWTTTLESGPAFDGDVHGWIGPLPRIRPLRTDCEAPR